MDFISMLDIKNSLLSGFVGISFFIVFSIFIYTPWGKKVSRFLNRSIIRGFFILTLALLGPIIASNATLINLEIEEKEYLIFRKNIEPSCSSHIADSNKIYRKEYNQYIHCKKFHDIKESGEAILKIFK